MNRRFVIIAGALLFGGLALLWFVNTQVGFAPPPAAVSSPGAATNPATTGESRSAPLTPNRKVRLVIGSLGLRDDQEDQQVGDLLTVELASAAGLELVDRQSLAAVLREAEMNLSGLVRAREAVRVGRLLRADWFLIGSLATSPASNAVVARVVDARTGIMRDVGIVPADANPTRLAGALAAFVRQSREAANQPRSEVYLAIGAFDDLSVNNRQAAFPAELRAYLTAAFQNEPHVTLLEREYVNMLLREVRLDLAGLTENGTAEAPPRFQSAFWLVDGYYQSRETDRVEVELSLNVRRVFGRKTTFLLRDQPGTPMFAKIKDAVETTLRTNVVVLAPTRASEARTQLSVGRELAGLDGSVPFAMPTRAWDDDQQVARQRRNVEEAIRAFETVLLLEPTNRPARLHLGVCLASQYVGRIPEALEYFRELILEPVEDHWSWSARQGLHYALLNFSPAERARWCAKAAAGTTNSIGAAFLEQEAGTAGRDAAIGSGGEGVGRSSGSATKASGSDSKPQQLAEARLFDHLRGFDAGREGGGAMGMSEFAETFGTNRAAAARRLNELLPQMKAQAPNSTPFVLAALVTMQVETNAPVIAEFEAALARLVEHPEEAPVRMESFWSWTDGVYHWSMEHRVYPLGARVVEARLRAAATNPRLNILGDRDQAMMSLAFAYMGMQSWTNALEIFRGYSNQPVYMGGGGPWGRAFTVILTRRQADYCRQKLGRAPERNPREFDFGQAVLPLFWEGDPSGSQLYLSKGGAFATASDGLWIAIHGQLRHLDFALKTNHVVRLPVDPATPITCVASDATRVWVATGGAGLVEYDKERGQCSRLTEKDGLLLDFVATLQAVDSRLWLGYGQLSSGGLGLLDLTTRRLRAFTPSMTVTRNEDAAPTRLPVVSLALSRGGQVWMVTKSALCRYQSVNDVWDRPLPVTPLTSVASDGERLYAGLGVAPAQPVSQPSELGVRIFEERSQQWTRFPTVAGLPCQRVTTVTSDNGRLWVGGLGYVALLDPVKLQVLRFAYVRARRVEEIHVGGGYVWAQFEWQLYRAPL